MKLILTGAGGFVGREVLRQIGRRHDVIAVDTSLGGIAGIEGDLTDPEVLERATGQGCDGVIHLATVPGGAAEAHPELAKRVNIDATMALVSAIARAGAKPRFVFASSIAVFGDNLPDTVDDDTPLAPKMLYGAHKAMMEEWVSTHTRRGTISGVSLRLSGVVARPRGPSGMKSAFMSEVFHALAARERIGLPVSAGATMWITSVEQAAANLIHGLEGGAEGAMTLPASRTTMEGLVRTISDETGAPAGLAFYDPDPAIEAAFGRLPHLSTTRAEELGFRADASMGSLVRSALGFVNRGEGA